MSADHPIHPATIHFPIAFLTLSYGLDVLHAMTPYLPKSFLSQLPISTDLTRASYYLLTAGLITSIPAVMSGGAQSYKMISKQGMYEADNKTIKPKVQTTLLHAVSNDIVLAVSAYVWWCRRQAAQTTVAGKVGLSSAGAGAATYAPEMWQVALSAVLLPLFFYALKLGGTLTYNYGVGFSPISSGKGKKSQ